MSKKSPQPAPAAIRQSTEATKPDYETVAIRAFELWVSRGCPIGSPEIDWEQAEHELMEEAPAPAKAQVQSHAA